MPYHKWNSGRPIKLIKNILVFSVDVIPSSLHIITIFVIIKYNKISNLSNLFIVFKFKSHFTVILNIINYAKINSNKKLLVDLIY
jgi:hypothetical protein